MEIGGSRSVAVGMDDKEGVSEVEGVRDREGRVGIRGMAEEELSLPRTFSLNTTS
jgi:hypothetical protein